MSLAWQEQIAFFTSQFHWLRPWWLLAFIPVLVLAVYLWRLKRHAHQWQQMVSPELLPFLLDGKTTGTRKSLLWGVIIAWSLAIVALAGPSWIKRPLPVEKNQSALVVILDLSQSMLSEDVKPSRLARAKLKITDMLRARKDGQTALVVYAGDAHTVTPLSDDSATINSLLQALSPNIMPVPGSNTEAAIERGLQLLRDAGANGGDLLLITDGVVPEAFGRIRNLLATSKVKLSIMGVGGHEPAPIPSSKGGFMRDAQGGIITTKLNADELASLAQSLRGRYMDMANTDRDIEYLLPSAQQDDKDNLNKMERDFDQWFDQGRWLVLLVLPFVLVAFRRGLTLLLLCALSFGFSAAPQTAYAWSLQESLDSFWLTKDQQAERQLNAGDAKSAAETFQSPDWKAAAQYRAGDYEAAANSYAQSDTANAHYNRGNALAKVGKLPDAIKAYDEALKRDTALEDARKNRELVDKLLKQQQQQQQQQNNQNDQQNKDQQNKDKQNQDQQNQDQQNQQNQDQQQNDQQKQDQQSQNQQNSSASNSESNSQQQSGQQSSAGSSAGAQGQQQSSSQQQSSAGAEQQAAEQAQSSAGKDDKSQAVPQSELTQEQQQALEQWLRRVPDDPGGLLRNKFKWQYIENRQKQMDGNYQGPDNNADQRW
jgi:Ca-activated chloride channel homolog